MASPATIATIRAWVGGEPGDADLSSRFERLGSANAVALEVLRQRRADIVANPASVSLSGDYSEDWTENLKVLDGDIGRLTALVASENADSGGNTITVGLLTRPDRERM